MSGTVSQPAKVSETLGGDLKGDGEDGSNSEGPWNAIQISVEDGTKLWERELGADGSYAESLEGYHNRAGRKITGMTA